MKKLVEAARLETAVLQSPIGITVYVAEKYAAYYTTPPRNGRNYCVRDQLRKNVCHWTFPDGTYECHDATGQIGKAPISIVTVRKKKVKPADGWKPSKQRLASQFTKGKVIKDQSDAPPEFCLIDIERVMRITGFKKSFIYDRIDFPRPVQLGESQRAAVRWVESEVIDWVKQLAAKRQEDSTTN